MKMHNARKSGKALCPVCGAEALRPCRHAEPAADTRDPLDDEEARSAWCEYNLMVAVHNLRDVNPDHYLVRLIETALTNDEPEQLSLFDSGFMTRNQAE